MTPETLQAQFGEAVEAAEQVGRELHVRVQPSLWHALAEYCRDNGYGYFSDLTAVDNGSELRIVCRLMHETTHDQIVLSVGLTRTNGRLASLSHIFGGANWAEREAFDMFGVRFDGHPDMNRIMLEEDWQGYPLLKTGQAK
jgi:NADH-quinone oxidoreductase subunit C